MFIRVDWLIEEDEVVRADFAAAPWGRRFCRIVGALIALVPVGLYVAHRARNLPWDWTDLGRCWALACFFFLIPAWGGHLLRKQFRSSGQVKQSFTFTEEGVTVDFVDVDGERQVFRPWSAFHKLESNGEFFFLSMTPTHCAPVPKRVFDADALALFSRFVEYGFAETWGTDRPAASDDSAQAEAEAE